MALLQYLTPGQIVWNIPKTRAGGGHLRWGTVESVQILEIDLENGRVRAQQGKRRARWYGEDHAFQWRVNPPERLQVLFRRFRDLETAA